MNGLEKIEAYVSGRIEPPPIAALVGIRFEGVAKGQAILSLRTERRHTNPMGTLHGGVLCDLGDAAMGCAVATTLEEGETYTTIELKVNFFKPIRDAGLLAVGRVVRRTRSLAYAECEVTDSGQSLVAKLACTCMVLHGDAARGR